MMFLQHLMMPKQTAKVIIHNLYFVRINKKNNGYPCKPQFYCIKVGFKGSKLYRHVSVMFLQHLMMPKQTAKVITNGLMGDIT